MPAITRIGESGKGNQLPNYAITQLPNFNQSEPTLPALHELRDHRVRRRGGFEPRGRLALREVEQIAIAHEIDQTERRQTGLPGAEKIARPPQTQIALRDLEAVGGVGHRAQPLARLLRQRRLVHEEAERLMSIAADAPPQLV